MSDPNRLAPSVVPEFAENTPDHHAIASASVASPEVEATQAPQLQAIIQNAMTGAAFQSEKKQIERVGDILAWRYFGKPGDELPEGLAITPWERNQAFLSVEFEPDKQVSCLQFGDICKRLEQYGLNSVKQAIAGDIASRQPEIEHRLTSLITKTPTCQLLQSFAIAGPNEAIEVPLDEATKTAQRGALRKQYDADALEQIRPRTPQEITQQFGGQFALKRASFALNLETRMIQQPKAAPSALQRVRAYFAPTIVDTLSPPRDDIHTDDEQKRRHFINGLIRGDSDVTVRFNVTDFDIDQHAIFVDNAQGLNPLDHLLGSALLKEILPVLYNPNHQGAGNYRDLLDTAVKAVAEAYAAQLTTIDFTEFNRYGNPALSPYFLAPKAVLVSNITQSKEPLPLLPERINQIRSLERLRVEDATKVGTIMYGNPGTVRVIGLQGQEPRGPHPTDVDLVVHLDDREALYRLFDPDIPGYDLVSREGQQFGFKKAEFDPYEEDGTVLPDDLTAVSKKLRKLGLHIPELAKPNLTVTELANILSGHTSYPAPSEKSGFSLSRKDGAPRGLPRVYNLDRLADLRRFIFKKKFWAQCTGSDSFARLVLGELLPEGRRAVTAINGHVISPFTARITGASHRQTVVNLGGTTRIIDATSKEQEMVIDVDARRRLFGVKANAIREIVTVVDPQEESFIPEPRQKPEAERIEKAEPTISPEPQPKTIPTAERIAGIHDGLTTQLVQVLGTVTLEQLYKTVVKLPEGVDPIKRTVQISLRARSGTATGEDVAELARYLEVYRATTPQQRDQVGVESYGDSLVDMLALTATKLQHYLPVKAEEHA